MRKPGAIVVDRLRDRVLLGRYFGRWAPGDRLPSVRDVARLESVDRKTAAAAYRRLESEGLVRVEARSGVYLADGSLDGLGDPLRRLHRQWLEHTLDSAARLGLGSGSVVRLIQGVAQVEGRRIPLVDADPQHGALLARELGSRTGLEFGHCRPDQVPALSGPLRDAPFLVATPGAVASFRSTQRALPIVHATLAPELLSAVDRLAAAGGVVVVVVGTDGLVTELGRAIEHGLISNGSRVRVIRATRSGDGLEDGADRVVLWPGTSPTTAERLGDRAVDLTGAALLSARTVVAVRRQVARSAIDYVSRSTVA